jgi:hypothetical protein
MPNRKKQKHLDYQLNSSLKTCLKELIPVFLPDYKHFIEFSDEEIKNTIRKTIRREADHLHLFHIPDKEVILHIEHQHQITDEIKKRMLLYAALIYDKYPDKQLVQAVIYTGKSQFNIKPNIQLTNLQFNFPIIQLRNIPLSKFLSINNLLAYSWGAASIKTEIELNQFYDKFVELQEESNKDIIPNAYGIVEDLLLDNLTKIFEILTKQTMTYRSRILDNIAKELAEKEVMTAKELAEKEVMTAKELAKKEVESRISKTIENCLKKGLSTRETSELTEMPIETVREIAKKLGLE